MPPNIMAVPSAVSAARTPAAQNRRPETALDGVRVTAALQLLERKGLYGLNGIEGFVDQAAGIGDPILRRARQAGARGGRPAGWGR